MAKLFLSGILVAMASSTAALAELPQPRLYWVFPPGGRQATKVDVSIGGYDLDEADRLVFTHPGITAAPKSMPSPEVETQPTVPRDPFVVNIAADVPPGVYEVRAAGRYGTSTSRLFEVDELPEIVERGDNHSFDNALPVTMNTVVNARGEPDNVDVFQFAAKRGERAIIRCAARRIDSRMRPVLEVIDAAGKQLALGRATQRREPLIDFTAPADGDYRIRVFDATYGGGDQFFYRLELSARPWIDFVYPPAGAPGVTDRFTLFGRNLPGGSAAQIATGTGENLEQLAVDILVPTQPSILGLSPASILKTPLEAEVQGVEYRLSTAAGSSNPVFISFARSPVVAEQEPNDSPAKPQLLSLPSEVVGQFYPHRDVDWFSFEAKQGETYALEVFSERLNLPTDPAIVVQHVATDAQGKETVRVVQEQDDMERKSLDPPFNGHPHDVAMIFKADANGMHRVLLRDQYAASNAHPRHVYRMIIGSPQPDFHLVATTRVLIEASSPAERLIAGSPMLRRGGTQPILVQAYRHGGFDGPIALTVEGLPANVDCAPVAIGTGRQQANLVLTASADAAGWSGPIKIVGAAKLNDQDVRREALAGTIVWDKTTTNEETFGRLARETMLSVTPEIAPVSVSLVENKPWEIARGGKIAVPLKIDRRAELKGNATLETRGLPPEIKASPVTLKSEVTEAKVEITADASAPLGEYAFYFVWQGIIVYERNPAAVGAAEEKKKDTEIFAASPSITLRVVETIEAKSR